MSININTPTITFTNNTNYYVQVGFNIPGVGLFFLSGPSLNQELLVNPGQTVTAQLPGTPDTILLYLFQSSNIMEGPVRTIQQGINGQTNFVLNNNGLSTVGASSGPDIGLLIGIGVLALLLIALAYSRK
ncbi:hypothetical protein MTIV3_ORF28 [Metallosphaera turreted icosahedral virus 3]|nr:hypothetical protein MTIV3_ORF28 [Metallosphaera turreted icosahedral virus 3]